MDKYKKSMIGASIVILMPMLIGILLWNQLPDEIATHFSFDGTPDGWSGKGFAVFGMPLVLLVLQWVAMTVTLQDPKRQNMSEKLLKMILWLIPVMSWLVAFVCYGYALGYETSHGSWGSALIGVMFLVVGNYLPKCRQNYTMGIKIPWTLHDEENWNHTHRMAGYLWIACGLVLLINIFLKQDWIIITAILLAAFIPMIYSYWYYRKHNTEWE